MNLKKNLIPVKECPICKGKKFINHGSVDGIHPDLIKGDQMNVVGIKK